MSEDEEIVFTESWPFDDEEVNQEIEQGRSLGDDLSESEEETPSVGAEISSSNNSSSSSGQSINTIIMTSKVDIGGEEIEISNTKIKATTDMTTLYPKTVRESLKKENKLNELFEKATRLRISKLDLISLSLSEEDKLDDTYNIGIQIGKIKSYFTCYDMHDVMGIVEFGSQGFTNPIGKKDLFEHYPSITEEEVAKSNQFYNEYTVKDYYRQNLQLNLEFLENNTTEALWEKCLEEYEEYPQNQRGGPLMFLIIMKKLQSHTDLAVQYLTNSIKNMKITNFEGEDVNRATSLIRGAHKRLKMISKVPEEYPQWVLQVFQTTTVSEFNQAFAPIKREVEVVQPLMSKTIKPVYPSIEDLVKMAEKLYTNLSSTNTWTGVKTKANQSGFIANDKKNPTCWNCGQEGNSLKECPKPKNTETISQRRKAHYDAIKNKKGKDKEQDKRKDGKKESNIGK
jgi:hypothetical protein